MDAEEDTLPRPSDDGLGTVEDYREGALKYTSFLEQTISTDLDGLKVVIDGANGATSSFIANLFADVNADFIPLHVSPNGLNTNLNCGSTHPADLQKAVVELPLTVMGTVVSPLTTRGTWSTVIRLCTSVVRAWKLTGV